MSSVKFVKKREKKATFLHRIINVFVFAILCLFPLVVTDRYHNILITKYYFYIGAVVFLVISLIIAAGIRRDMLECYFQRFDIKKFLKSFSVTDWALIAFLLIAAWSTITSDYLFESFWGNEGRYSGLFLLILYGVAYFCVTRFGKMEKWYLDAFLICGILLSSFGITDYFQLDLLHFKESMVETEKFMFTSTIGNINTYTAIVGMYTAVSAVLFSFEKAWKRRSFYYASLIITLFALIMGISDNAYLSLAALFGLLPFCLFNLKEGVKYYIVLLASLFTVILCTGWVNTILPNKVLGIDSAFNLISSYNGLVVVTICLWITAMLWYAGDHSARKKREVVGKWLCYLWLAVIAFVIACLSYILYDANINGNMARWGAFGNYFIFNDDWGTHRGYIWRNAMEAFAEFSPYKKIFGYGPDTFGIILLDKTRNNIYKQTYDNAHNEYIHYLLTVGGAGLGAYLLMIGAYIVRTVHRTLNNPLAKAVLFAVICYIVQAIVNLNLPIATPVMWMLLALGELMNRKALVSNETLK